MCLLKLDFVNVAYNNIETNQTNSAPFRYTIDATAS